MTSLHIDYFKAANIIFSHKMNKIRIDKFPTNCQPKTSNDAYKIQNELKNLLLLLKKNYCIGKKIGCTNKMAQKQLDINEPFYGNLFSKFSNVSGCILNSSDFSKPYFEPEFSFIIKDDIDISKAPFTFKQILNLVKCVIGSVEIVDFRFKDDLKAIGINNLIAANGASDYWIKGNIEFELSKLNLFNHQVKVFINNQLIEEGNSSNVLENPLNSLLWLINKLSLNGETLLKNNIISTGTCTKAIPLIKNSDIKIDFGIMGFVNFKFI